MKVRFNQIILAIGDKGTGKTSFMLRELIPLYLKNHQDKRILVLCEGDHDMLQHIPRISSAMLPRWRGIGVCRIFGEDEDKVFTAIKQYVNNALIIYEDATNYIEGEITADTRVNLIKSKQKNNDSFFMFHGVSDCPPKLFKKADSLVLFKGEDPTYRKKELGSNYHAVYEAWRKVMADQNRFAYKIIKLK